MTFTEHTMAQGTPEWFSVRVGLPTASHAKDILAKGRGNQEAVTRRNYRIEKALERVTGQPAASVKPTWQMEWGTEHEPEARSRYEAETGLLVSESGFLACNEVPVGASPFAFRTEGPWA